MATVSPLRAIEAEDYDDDELGDMAAAMNRDTGVWERTAIKVRFWFRAAAIIFLCCFIVAWPIGMSLSAYQRTGLFTIEFGLTFPILIVVLGISVIIFVIGQLVSLLLRIVAKAEEIERSSARLTAPETHAVTNVRSVGKAVQTEISTLNTYLDQALVKLASAESMIRKQVQAIDTVGDSLKDGSGDLVGAVAREREKLIELTETMNAQADAFAEAIAEKAKLGEQTSRASEERASAAEAELEARLTRLEETAEKALGAFETLAAAFEQQRSKISDNNTAFDDYSRKAIEKSASVTKAFEENTQAISTAQERLRAESERLESLITQQRERADKLAEAIAKQTEKLSDLAEKRNRIEPRLAAPVTRPSLSLGTISDDADTANAAPVRDPGTNTRPPLGDIRTGRPSEGQNKSRADQSAPGRVEPTLSTPGLKRPEAPASREERQSTSWRDILAAAEEEKAPETEAPAKPQLGLHKVTPVTSPAREDTAGEKRFGNGNASQTPPASQRADGDIVWLIRRMQSFMVEIDTRLYGKPASEKLERYKCGERNIFANEILQRDEPEFRRRLKAEVDRNEGFERSVFDFLANFDALLEPDDEDETDSLIDDYLGSPLGQVYVLIGTTLDYFS